ncbi:MAG: transcriptional regulator [Methylovulum sp.]|nr:MAG: transcriptional regulator [Methylovulum sp.]
MAKRLTLDQFEQVVSGMQLNAKTVEIAREVLVEGKPQIELVAATGLTKGAISQAVNRVWLEYETKAKGGERVSVVLPEHQAYIVKQWAAHFADKPDKKK